MFSAFKYIFEFIYRDLFLKTITNNYCQALNVMIQKYSLAIQPNEPVLSRVTEMKQQLRRAIGHYCSANSEAHISLFEFELDEKKYSIALSYFKKVIAGFAPFHITYEGLSHFKHLPYFTFYVKLVGSSSQTIVNYCKQIKKT